MDAIRAAQIRRALHSRGNMFRFRDERQKHARTITQRELIVDLVTLLKTDRLWRESDCGSFAASKDHLEEARLWLKRVAK